LTKLLKGQKNKTMISGECIYHLAPLRDLCPRCYLYDRNGENIMDVDLIFRIAAIGIIVSVLNQVLIRSGREEQAMMTTLAGLIVVLMMMIYEINALFETVKTVFNL